MTKGKFIVFEGISGTGKETQARLLQKHLTDRHITSHIIFHPTPELKIILSDWRKVRNADNMTEVYLLLADRHTVVANQIMPALSRGNWVISLRNQISALVYQGKTRKERDWISHQFSVFEPKPDALFFFDITPQHALERIMGRHRATGEALGKFETPEYLTEKSQIYRTIMKPYHPQHIDASLSIQEIHQTISIYCNTRLMT